MSCVSVKWIGKHVLWKQNKEENISTSNIIHSQVHQKAGGSIPHVTVNLAETLSPKLALVLHHQCVNGKKSAWPNQTRVYEWV